MTPGTVSRRVAGRRFPLCAIFAHDECHRANNFGTMASSILSCSARSRRLKHLRLRLESARSLGFENSMAEGVGASGKVSRGSDSPMVHLSR